MKLTNNAKRALGIPGAHGSIILQSGQSVMISPADLDKIKRNKTAASWLHNGLIDIDGSGAEKAPAVKAVPEAKKPEAPVNEGKGVEVVAQGKGWYRVFVAGIEVSQGGMRKDDADALAAQYENRPAEPEPETEPES